MKKGNKNFKVLGIIFILVGLFYVVIFEGSNYLFLTVGNRAKADAIIEKVNEDSIDVVYNIDDEEIHINLKEDPDEYHKGQKIKVYYDKDNHKDAFVMTTFNGFPASIFGGMFCVVGIIFYIIYYKNNKLYKRLMENGTIVSAKIVNISKVGVSSYIINCEFDGFDGKKYYYKSDTLNYNPADILNYKEIDKISVYVDMNNLNNYYVDISNIRW